MNNTRDEILDIAHSRSNRLSNRNEKWFIKPILGIVVLLAFFTAAISTVISQLDFNGVGLNTNSNSNSQRQLNEIDDTIIIEDEKHTNADNGISDNIIEDIIKEKYIGNWTPILFSSADNSDADLIMLKDIKEGRVEVEFKQDKDNKQFTIKSKCLAGLYIDNWFSFESTIPSHDLSISNNNQSSLILESNSTSFESKGRLFHHHSKNKSCNSTISMTLIKDSSGVIDFNQFTFTYNSSCGLNLNLSLVQNIGKVSNTLREKISFYTFIASTSVTISMIINFYLIKMLTQAESNIKAMSITFISLNAIWNVYSIASNLAFAIRFIDHFFQFIIPSILFLCLFLLVDLQLFYYYFIIRRKTLSDRDVKRRLIAFCVLVTIGLGTSFYFIYDLYFEKIGLLCLSIALWLPQIVHNVLSNNKTALPIVYTILATVTRLTIPLYFRGYVNNCFSIKTDGLLLVKCLIIEGFLLLFMSSQSLFGARWFLPKCLKKNLKEEIYFYSEKDAMELFPNYLDEDCVICLNRLFTQAIQLSDISGNGNKDVNSNDGEISSRYSKIKNANDVLVAALDSNAAGNDSASSSGFPRFSLELITSVVLSALLDFHEWKFKQKKNVLPYMITQCNHLFHAQCLELWLRQVKKCPSCRKEITIIPI